MKKMKFIATVFTIGFLIDLLLHIFQPLGDNFYIVSNILAIFFSLLAFLFGATSYRLHGISKFRGATLLFLTAGLFFWFLGEFAWGFYEIFLGVEAPVVSAADIFWLAGYPLLMIGICLVWNSTKMKVNNRRMIPSVVLSALLLVICFYLSTPALTSTDLSLPEKVTTAGYIIGDAGLLIAVIVTMVHIPSKELFRLWVAILTALALITAADVLYTYFLSSYFTGHIIDVLWDLGYILLAFGFFNYAVKYRKVLDIVFKNID